MRPKPSFTAQSVPTTQNTGSALSPTTAPSDNTSGNLWGMVLAGGHGRRVQHFMRRLNGSEIPKQFCAVIGRRSMLQHTLDRTTVAIPPERILTVILREQLGIAREQLSGWPSECLVVQPSNRDTAPGILLPILRIQARDPEAMIAIFPADHFVWEEGIFMAHVLQAVEFLEEHPDLLILLGIAPDRPETAYGWIEPGEAVASRAGYRLLRVKSFREKPDADTAYQLYLQGGLWNSLVMLGRLPTWLGVIERMLPDLWDRFRSVRAALGTTRETKMLEEVYRDMPAFNISRDLLERVPDRLGVMPVKGVLWSDWGNEKRIFETLGRIGRVEEVLGRLERQYRLREEVA